MEDIHLLIGLGNPGREYRENRHNVGFMLMDLLAVRLGVGFTRLQFKALVASGKLADQRVLLAKPQGYMNLSGGPVASLMRFYRVEAGCLLVAHDDIDLPLGSLRLRPGGGSAGQKGVQSIQDRLGTRDLPRLRIGIGRPPGRMDAAAYVLQDFPADEKQVVAEVLGRACEAAVAWISEGMQAAMNRYNSAPKE